MRTEKKGLLALACVIALAVGGVLRAADSIPTTITVPGIGCKCCAKKVSACLAAVPGVGDVQTTAAAAVVKPKAGVTLSPRALWEAVEQADKEPTKLEGPAGTFTSKPQS